jgi:hypothetical protein
MNPKFWDYFLYIESDLAACSRYVELARSNYNTYSNEFARIIMVASSEIDTIFRELCKNISPSSNPSNILEYYPIITERFPTIIEHGVVMLNHDLTFEPWRAWSSTVSPDWWSKAYNKIKHERTTNFEQANLENALLSVSALLLLILYYHEQVSGGAVRVGVGQLTQLFYPRPVTPVTMTGGSTTYIYGIQ